MDKQQGAINKRALSYTCWMLAITLLLIWVSVQWLAPKYLPIRNVQIHGTYQTATQAELQQLLMPIVTGSYFTVDVKAVAQTLLDLPWVATVTVKRVWPDTLLVNLTEQHVFVRWNEDKFINMEGEEFIPYDGEADRQLAHLWGPSDKAKQVLAHHHEFNDLLSPHGLSIVEIALTENSVWHLRLNNGLAMNIGDEDAFDGMLQFMALYPEMFEHRVDDIDYVDLRYANGVAVRWKID